MCPTVTAQHGIYSSLSIYSDTVAYFVVLFCLFVFCVPVLIVCLNLILFEFDFVCFVFVCCFCLCFFCPRTCVFVRHYRFLVVLIAFLSKISSAIRLLSLLKLLTVFLHLRWSCILLALL